MQNVELVGIAGGSGSGKSTLAISLVRAYPDTFALLHLDDYYKDKAKLPTLRGQLDRDSPEAFKFDILRADLLHLLGGQAITVATKSELYHPSYDPQRRNKIEHRIEPRPAIILEGHLALWSEPVRRLMSHAIYLDAPIQESVSRLSPQKLNLGQEYFEKVVEPVHTDVVEPTKQYADLVVDAMELAPEEVVTIATRNLGLAH